MWKDLTLQQKAEIMKMSVANGVTDINDIRALYDGSVGHKFDNAGRIITLADLPREYVQKYGHINVVTPKGVRMPLSQAYRDYNQTPINVNDVPGLTDYLIKQDQPDIAEQAYIDKVAADREIRQRNSIINGPIFDKEKIYNRVPGDMWQAVISDENNQSVEANSGITRSLLGYYFNPDNAVESRLRRYEKYKDLSMEEVMNAGIEFDRMWDEYGLDSIRNNPILSRKMTELESKMRAPHILQHEDAKDLYLGLPQRNNTMKDAEYSPTNGKLRNGKYISYMRDPAFVNDVIMKSYNDLKYGFIDKETTHPGLYKDHVYKERLTPVKEITPKGYARVEFPFLNNATLSGGIDPQRGEYASIFDTWDYNTNIMGTPGDNVGKYIGGEPFDIYDRYYLDDYYGINSKPQDNGYYGGYLPEMIVINKKALGGHLFDKGGSKKDYIDPNVSIYAALKQAGIPFKTSNPSGYRGPGHYVGKAGARSQHAQKRPDGTAWALDITGDFNEIRRKINASKPLQDYFKANGISVSEELTKEALARTGGTGPHFHIGRSSGHSHQDNPTISAYHKMYGKPDLSISNDVLYNPAQELRWQQAPLQNSLQTMQLAQTPMQISMPRVEITPITPIEERVPISDTLPDISPLLLSLPDQQGFTPHRMVTPQYQPVNLNLDSPYLLFRS